MQTDKNRWRKDLKRLRQEIPGSLRKQNNLDIRRNLLSLQGLGDAKSIFCFVSYGAEVDTHGIIDELLRQGKQLAVPKITESRLMNAIQFQDWGDLEAGELGILSPRWATAIIDKFDVTITPGLGFTERGDRLGFGRGYYDAWFRKNDPGLKIALSYEAQINANLPVEAHDVKVDIIVTEERIIRV